MEAEVFVEVRGRSGQVEPRTRGVGVKGGLQPSEVEGSRWRKQELQEEQKELVLRMTVTPGSCALVLEHCLG